MVHEPMVRSGAPATPGRKNYANARFFWFELPIAQQRLRASFAQSEVPAKAQNWNSASRNVNATFDWLRLAQRIPVRIKLVDVPNEKSLSSGMPATVRIEPKRESEKEAHQVFK
jgi:hypothetical protein